MRIQGYVTLHALYIVGRAGLSGIGVGVYLYLCMKRGIRMMSTAVQQPVPGTMLYFTAVGTLRWAQRESKPAHMDKKTTYPGMSTHHSCFGLLSIPCTAV